MKEKRRNSAVP